MIANCLTLPNLNILSKSHLFKILCRRSFYNLDKKKIKKGRSVPRSGTIFAEWRKKPDFLVSYRTTTRRLK